MTLTRPLHADIDLLALHRLAPQRYPALLESSASGTAHGRWDVLLLAQGAQLRLDQDGCTRNGDGQLLEGSFLDALDAAWQAERLPHEGDRSWPFRGGWAVLLDYEVAAQVEPILRLPMRSDAAPAALALRAPAAVLRDRMDGRCFAVAEPGREDLLQQIDDDITACASLPALPAWAAPTVVQEDPPEQFTDAVLRVLDYLRAGDVFQANISRAWQAQFDRPVDPAALHARLRAANPAPFSGLFVAAGRAVVSSSPERLVSVHGQVVQTRPIAGTRARFAGDDDAARIRELVGHPKERAEHVMLIDLERNDLGRICAPGSVEVDELMGVESYAHVHHIVSNVRGRLRQGVTPGEVIAAVFPGGTITGCPKVRCMQIIAELEQTARGAYTGAFGWLNRDGDMDLNILIRTAEVAGSQVRFRTGAGIVVDSDPQRELDETRAKARGLLRALDPA
ncbi:aminodeoxychorismate synthase component I [Xanthomonas sp. NCPPB 2922]|uniref:aminodeoxychorismate synthase component I n=1 Tax=Xanthomonas TaxID=338 RepID=UPI00096C929B|nr:aminodeoxychorismate synthase component I [Xanthomonas campestris]MCC5094309.1 aminodeoxychorismate synthase component I [Xanthomonas campestris pv. incanae]MEA9620061.1 aminodeoxychorismate synthase component I [Xanthomonas campestris pv. incanae]WDJ10991.1 aminodeoxychorismate synthase component I [Xanthomonas campestris pv. incanae]